MAQAEKSSVSSEKELFVKMIIDAWETQNLKVDKLLETVSDEQLQAETIPNKNSGIYLIGHLTAVNDGLISILGLGEKLYPQLEEIFLKNPDRADLKKPAISELRQYWNEINSKLRENFANFSADEWFTKHNSVSAEDFAKEPHRNKLNVLISRTNHQSYHLGQLNYLTNR